jgi:glycolate oxidase FAD binding subunit
MQHLIESFSDTLREASRAGTALAIRGGGTKGFYGRATAGGEFRVDAYAGIIDYSPAELVVTARAGTPLAALEAALAQENQMLAFEPPHFGATATAGGAVACGLSGPRRPYAGALRDHVLGITCLNGAGRRLRFGGQVMKNVAGYDLSRGLAGSLGTLALLLDISFKVLPRPEAELTLRRETSAAEAIALFNRWAGTPVPLSAACYHEGRLTARLSGFERGVKAAACALGGGELPEAGSFWEDLREHRLAFFDDPRPLWRLSLPPATPPLGLDGECFIDWGGGQRWYKTDLTAAALRQAASAAGGHALCFRNHSGNDVFHPLPGPLLALHRRLKRSFDPAGILNPGRMYPEL